MINNNRQQVSTAEQLLRSFARTKPLLAITLTLAAGFWAASSPLARAAAGKTPAEMLQSQLPQPTNLVTASKSEVLAATCKAIQGNPKDAPEIVRTAAGARRELTSDIFKTAVTCIKTSGKGDPDCDIARSTLQQAIAVSGDQAASLTEMFVSLAPTCGDSPEEGPGINFTNVNNVNGAPGTVSGGAANNGDTCSVCHNNQSIQVKCSSLNNYLQTHPGDTAGACEATPDSNK